MGRNLQFRPADPTLKLASGSNQPQPFERGLQSALATLDIDIDFRGSQVECPSIDLKTAVIAATQHIFWPLRAGFYFSCLNFAIRIGGAPLRDTGGD
jgi:hypothetical protein